MSVAGPVQRTFGALASLAAGVFLLWSAVSEQARNARLEANPHATATVARTWATYGKHPARMADLSFPSPGGGAVLCHASAIRLGPSSLHVSPGQLVDIVPIPGSCAPPDVPSQRLAAWLIWLQVGLAFFVFTTGLLALVGAPAFGRRASWGGAF